jgi:hypothetical protein
MPRYDDPSGQLTPNIIIDAVKAFGDVPAVYGTLIALPATYVYTHLVIVNSLDADILIKFGTNEITFQLNKDLVLDDFKYNGTIEYKYKVGAPTSGSLQIICC